MRKVFFICSFIFTLYFYGQNNIEISLQQDARLLLVGDQKGNYPLTTNILSKLEFPVFNFKESYFSTYISVEYADLVIKNYKRFAIGTGYVIESIYRKIGVGVYLDFGKIYRQKEGFYSFGLSGELNYKINDSLKFVCTQQLLQRQDLKILYKSKNEYIISGFIGFKYRL
jgi:hypothetical protein